MTSDYPIHDLEGDHATAARRHAAWMRDQLGGLDSPPPPIGPRPYLSATQLPAPGPMPTFTPVVVPDPPVDPLTDAVDLTRVIDTYMSARQQAYARYAAQTDEAWTHYRRSMATAAHEYESAVLEAGQRYDRGVDALERRPSDA